MKDGVAAVKAAIESTYACMGLNCTYDEDRPWKTGEAVGEFQTSGGVVYAGMEACEWASIKPDPPTSAPSTAPTPRPTPAPTTPNPSPRPTPAPTPAQTLVQVASSVTLEGIVADDFNADEAMKTAFAESILASAGGEFEEVIDIEAAGGRRRLAGAGVGVSYTGVARVVGTDDAASVGADLQARASDALKVALDGGNFLTTLQNANAAFAAVTVDVAATQAAIAAAVLTVIVTTPSPTVSPTPRPTVAPTATRGSDTVDAAHRLSGVSAALLVLALA